MRKLKLYLLYSKSLMSFNLPFSLLASLLSATINPDTLIGFINGFSAGLLTGGFILALYFYEQRNSGQYYFYHNLGLSKLNLIVGAYLFNVVIAILLILLKLYFYD